MSAETTLVLSLLANVVAIVLLKRDIRANDKKNDQHIATLAEQTTRLANAFITYVRSTRK